MNHNKAYFHCSNGYTCEMDHTGTMVPPNEKKFNIDAKTTTYTMTDTERSDMLQNGALRSAAASMNMEDTTENQTGTITTPPQGDFDNPAFQGSMQQILSENLGQFVVIEFLIGTQALTEKMGILYSVGRGFVVLYEELQNHYVVCDIFSIKFVTFYEPGQRPRGYQNSQTISTAKNTGKRLM